MNNLVNPEVGKFVYDFDAGKKVKVMAIKGNLYFVGKYREPFFRNEFIYPLPSQSKKNK